MAFSDSLLLSLRAPLTNADWTDDDIVLLKKADKERLVGIRDSLRGRGDIATDVMCGRTELWWHDGQKGSGYVQGHVIHRYLIDNPVILAGCVKVSDLKAIQAKGWDFWERYFHGMAICAWGSVQGDCVPCLFGDADDREVVLSSNWLDFNFHSSGPGLRRK